MIKFNPFYALNEGHTIYTKSMAYKTINGKIYFCHYHEGHIWSKLYGGIFKAFAMFDFFPEPQKREENGFVKYFDKPKSKEEIIQLLEQNQTFIPQ